MPSPQALRVSRKLQEVAKYVDASVEMVLGERIGFCLFVFSEGEVQYVANTTERAEVKAAMLAIINGWDAGMPDVPAHKKD